MNTTSSEKKQNYRHSPSLWEIFKFISGLIFLSLITYKLSTSELKFDFSKFDFNALLALILSIFAIGLSVAFYFKATDSSNLFYDNIYKFTKDISEILGRIEAGFGERLKHLDEGYSGLINKFDNKLNDQNIAETKEEIEKEKLKLKKDLQEREEILNSLLEKTQLDNAEKENFKKQLRDKEIEIRKQNRELEFLRFNLAENKHNVLSSSSTNTIISPIANRILENYISQNNITRETFAKRPLSILAKKYTLDLHQLTSQQIASLLNERIINEDGTFTIHGLRILRELSKLY